MKKILLTGGGSAGHITVNLALLPLFIQAGWSVIYVGSIDGIERELISSIQEVTYCAISTGKLRRYFDLQNVTDIFQVIKGIIQSYKIIQAEKPQIVFSKGGFVSVPVVLGSFLNKIPVVVHESDLTPGLANRITLRFAQKICTTFPDTVNKLPSAKGEFIGAIIRPELKQGDSAKGRDFCGFDSVKPIIMIVGGSLGSVRINQVLRSILDPLLAKYQVIHICGKGNLVKELNYPGYQQFEYVNQELPDLMSLADLVISRAGSNFIFEFLALRKPMILIPLSPKSSRGDQIENAQAFARQGFAEVILEESLTENLLLELVNSVFINREKYVAQMKTWSSERSLDKLFTLVTDQALSMSSEH
ncbi:MAG: UDP-N-acetylglucosamine--N-acetylmuramyl-(pentapeptide) pyrophosphoryl-undecaprenol [Cyanobacteriota bacterium]